MLEKDQLILLQHFNCVTLTPSLYPTHSASEFVAAQSMDRHPNQPHVVALGRGDGSICFWDLRQEGQPVSLIQAHSTEGESNVIMFAWSIRFHGVVVDQALLT